MEYLYIYLAVVAAIETSKFLSGRRGKIRDWFIRKIKRPIKKWIRGMKKKYKERNSSL